MAKKAKRGRNKVTTRFPMARSRIRDELRDTYIKNGEPPNVKMLTDTLLSFGSLKKELADGEGLSNATHNAKAEIKKELCPDQRWYCLGSDYDYCYWHPDMIRTEEDLWMCRASWSVRLGERARDDAKTEMMLDDIIACYKQCGLSLRVRRDEANRPQGIESA